MEKKADRQLSSYSRGNFKIEGTGESLEKVMEGDNRRYWFYKNLRAIALILAAVVAIIKALYPLFK